MRIALTGGTGKLGRHVHKRLCDAGHDVVVLDRFGPRGPDFIQIDLTDYGQVLDALAGVRGEAGKAGGFDAVVHLAAYPAPGVVTDVETFRNNAVATFGVFWAAIRLGIRNIVYASSETVLGLPFDIAPDYVPVDEASTRPESVYSLVKAMEETMAGHLCRWYPDLKIIGLRFSNVMDEADYAAFPSFDDDARKRKWNLWGYIDGVDGAQAVEKALAYDQPGFDYFVIASPDTVMSRPNAELLDEVFPGVERRGEIGEHDTLLSIDRARRVLGYDPQRSWRDFV
ncbi:MAG: NAD(P)-dependent oxidoreductase [Propionibacterium sp.]|nr:NAD(P)-dependent oxidoreductase [Propionibacterium sp.]